jgi:hypothetical protein
VFWALWTRTGETSRIRFETGLRLRLRIRMGRVMDVRRDSNGRIRVRWMGDLDCVFFVEDSDGDGD